MAGPLGAVAGSAIGGAAGAGGAHLAKGDDHPGATETGAAAGAATGAVVGGAVGGPLGSGIGAMIGGAVGGSAAKARRTRPATKTAR